MSTDSAPNVHPLASVVVPIFNGLGRVEQLIESLACQECSFAWDVAFVDSGSTDGTVQWLEQCAADFPVPLKVLGLGSEPFDHGDTRNFGAAHTRGDLIVFLTDDARPQGPQWLAQVVHALSDDKVGAVYCRNIVPADAPLWAQTLVESDRIYMDEPEAEPSSWSPNPGPHELRERALYCDTASAILRSVLERHPYPRSQAGEDMLLARGLRENGVHIQKLVSAPVEHLHLYSPDQMRARALLDGCFNKEAFGREIVAPGQTQSEAKIVEEMLAQASPSDQRGELKQRLQGFVQGAQAGLAMAHGRRWPTSMLETPALHVGVLFGTEQEALAGDYCDALASFGLQATSIPVEAFASIDATFDLLHFVAPSPSSVLVDSKPMPCITPDANGWGLHLFEYQIAPYGAHARPELQLAGVPHPLEEKPKDAAARWAFRYRQLASMARAKQAWQRWGYEAPVTRGEVRREGTVLITLGPGPAEVSFDLPPLGPLANELVVEVEFVAGDEGNTRCAIVHLDRREVAQVGLLSVPTSPSIRTSRLPIAVPRDGGRLTFTNRTPAGEPTIVRLRSIGIVRGPASSEEERLKVSSVLAGQRPSPAAKVKVVIPTLAGVARLSTCLPALFDSNDRGDRLSVVVIDNGCSEKTRRWLQDKYPQILRIDPTANIGFTQAANLGVVSGEETEFTIFLNDDAQVAPGFIAELMGPLEAGTCHATAARMLLPDGTPEYFGGAASFQGFAFGGPTDIDRVQRLDQPRKTIFACGGAMAIASKVFTTVGGFDPDYFAYYDDLDLGWRLNLQGYDVHYVPTAICTHARSSTSSSFRPASIRLLQVRNALCTCIKNLGDDALRATLPSLLALASRRMWIQGQQPKAKSIRIERLRPHGLHFHPGFRLPSMAMADLVGLQDVLGDWDAWMKKREIVQSMRKRLDVEVLPLFLDPLRCIEGEFEYMALQTSLTQLFHLPSLFCQTSCPAKPGS